MLVNEHTLSAGEMVAAFAEENRLAKIVGMRTGGQVRRLRRRGVRDVDNDRCTFKGLASPRR
jgi:C-terminal processing protease CtpA/Prc